MALPVVGAGGTGAGLPTDVAAELVALEGEVDPALPAESGATSDGRTAVLARPDAASTSVVVTSPGGGVEIVHRPGA